MIFDKSSDMLEVAENFLDFFEEESCGQCTPCREGILVLIEMLEKINGRRI
jgi:[NiFe] hydrogenase diaphorase moiety large subunit